MTGCLTGPANVDPRVSQALALPQVGHLDPFFQGLMQRIQQQLRYVWQTDNKVVFPVRDLFPSPNANPLRNVGAYQAVILSAFCLLSHLPPSNALPFE